MNLLEPAVVGTLADTVDQDKGCFFVGLKLIVALSPPAFTTGIRGKTEVKGGRSGIVDLSRKVIGGQCDRTTADVFQGDNHLDHMDDAIFIGAKDRAARLAAYIANAIYGAGNFNIFAAAAGGQGAVSPAASSAAPESLRNARLERFFMFSTSCPKTRAFCTVYHG